MQVFFITKLITGHFVITVVMCLQFHKYNFVTDKTINNSFLCMTVLFGAQLDHSTSDKSKQDLATPRRQVFQFSCSCQSVSQSVILYRANLPQLLSQKLEIWQVCSFYLLLAIIYVFVAIKQISLPKIGQKQHLYSLYKNVCGIFKLNTRLPSYERKTHPLWQLEQQRSLVIK